MVTVDNRGKVVLPLVLGSKHLTARPSKLMVPTQWEQGLGLLRYRHVN